MIKTHTAVFVLIVGALATSCGGGERSDGEPASRDVSPAPASRGAEQSEGKVNCDPADANRADKPPEEVAGTIAPAVPRRTCTLPQEGCVKLPNSGRLAPPAPGVRVIRVTQASIDVAYDLGSNLGDCLPRWLRVTVHTTISGLAPYGDNYRVSGSTGRLQVDRKQLPGPVDYGPPDMLVVSATTEEGLPSDAARVGLPAPGSEQRLSDAEARRIKARREACRADIDDRVTCELGGLHPVSGPVTAGTPARLARSIRDSLKGEGGFSLLSIKCVNGTRCHAAFSVSGHPLEMSYRIEALKSVPTCWELTAFSVTRPVRELGNFAAPLPRQGCVDR